MWVLEHLRRIIFLIGEKVEWFRIHLEYHRYSLNMIFMIYYDNLIGKVRV